MSVTRDTQFSVYQITNMNILFKGEEQAKKFGCTGELEIESEVKEVSKFCEGVKKESRSKVESVKAKFVGHVEKDVLRRVYGIKSDKLKPGVYSYGTDSIGDICALTADVYDLFKTDKMMIALPNCSVTSGMKFSIKNAEDTVAEIEIEFTCGTDENGNFYYEAFESEADDVKSFWHTKFEPSKVVQGV